jgi:predicted ATPase
MNRAIGALHISDGTLRFLLLESIFYNPQRGNIVAIDEPERGLHPDMIRSVAEMIKYAANSTQIIVATHSPHLLNQFELDDVLVFEKDEDNSTIVKSISEDDFSDWEGDYLPGQMWLLGQIGGKRW